MDKRCRETFLCIFAGIKSLIETVPFLRLISQTQLGRGGCALSRNDFVLLCFSNLHSWHEGKKNMLSLIVACESVEDNSKSAQYQYHKVDLH